MTTLADRITVDPALCGGRPCVRGLRIRVTDVLDLLASGLTPEAVIEELPDLQLEDACRHPGVQRAVLQHAQRRRAGPERDHHASAPNPRAKRASDRGVWIKTAGASREARGKCLGIVGYGHIGTQVGLLAEALGMQVIFFDLETKLALGNASPTRSLDELLARADVVTLHVPDTPQTVRMIGREQLARMRPGALLLNAARGSIIDVDALCAALDCGHIAGAAVDVFPDEPPSNDHEFVSPLRAFDNVLLTPHIGGSTIEAQHNIPSTAAT